MKIFYFLFAFVFISFTSLNAQNFVTAKKELGFFPIAGPNQIAAIYIDDKDDWLIQKMMNLPVHCMCGMHGLIIPMELIYITKKGYRLPRSEQINIQNRTNEAYWINVFLSLDSSNDRSGRVY